MLPLIFYYESTPTNLLLQGVSVVAVGISRTNSTTNILLPLIFYYESTPTNLLLQGVSVVAVGIGGKDSAKLFAKLVDFPEVFTTANI